MTKIRNSLIACLFALLAATPTHLTAQANESPSIMFVNPWPGLPFWATAAEGAADAAKKLEPLGVKYLEQGTPEGYSNASLVLSIIETGIAQSYDAIIHHPFIGDYVGKCRSGALTQGAASAGGCSALSRAG